MIDTLKINTPIVTNIATGSDWRSTETRTKFESVRHDFYEYLGVRFTISTRSGRGQWLSAEASIPKLIYGHNVGIVDSSEVKKSLDWIRTAILTLPFASRLPPLEEWKVSRMDLAYAWRIGDVEQVITDIYPSVRKTNSSDLIIFRDDHTDGMTLILDQTTLQRKLYDKGEQVKADKAVRSFSQKDRISLVSFAQGVMRFESRVDRRRIRRTIFKGDMLASDLVPYIEVNAEADLKRDLAGVCRSWRPATEQAVVASLMKEFGSRRSRALLGIYTSVESMGIERYQKLTDANKEVLRRDLAALRQAGVGFGKMVRSNNLDVPSPIVVWCRDLVLEDVVASLAREAA